MALVAIASSAAAVSTASAHEKLLTFYANDEVIPTGSPFVNTGFELVTDAPVKISIPSLGLSLSCPADPEFAVFGWFETNGHSTDVIGTNGYNTGPVRECSGVTFDGLLFDGTLHVGSGGHMVIGRNTYLDYRPQFKLESSKAGLEECYFFGNLAGKMSVPGPLTVTLKGAFRPANEPKCVRVADVEVGPLQGFYDAAPIEARVSP